MTDDKLSDGDFLRAFARDVQPTVGWPEWDWPPHHIVLEYHDPYWLRCKNGNRTTLCYDDHEAAELVRGHMRRKLLEQEGNSIHHHHNDVHWIKGYRLLVFPDENTALLAAFDAAKEKTP